MKAVQLLVTVLLVGAGIFVYDTVRSEPGGPSAPGDVPVLRSPAASISSSTEPTRVPDPITLSGAGTESLIAEVERLQARVTDLEARLARATPGEGPRGSVTTPTRWEPGSVANGVDPQFDPDDLRWFKAIKQEVERIERDEKYREMIGGQIDRLKLTVTEQQRSDVVEVTLTFREHVRETLEHASIDRLPKLKREELLDEIQVEYEQRIYGLVPGDAAAKIVERMGRYPRVVPGRRKGP